MLGREAGHALFERHGVAETAFSSGDAAAIEADEFRIARQLFDEIKFFLAGEDADVALVGFGITGFVAAAGTIGHTSSLS